MIDQLNVTLSPSADQFNVIYDWLETNSLMSLRINSKYNFSNFSFANKGFVTAKCHLKTDDHRYEVRASLVGKDAENFLEMIRGLK